MISDRDIFKISSILFAISFSILVLIAVFTTPKYIPLRKINSGIIGHTIKTSGTVKYIYSKNGNYFITLENVTRMKIVFFSSQARNNDMRSVKKNMTIEVIGKVSKYKGELEIIGEQINI